MEKEFNPDILKYNCSNLSCDYDSHDYPDGECECGDDAYSCTCRIYKGLRIKETSVLNMEYVLNQICTKKCSEIVRYCTDRILRIHEIYNIKNWSIEPERGYYGEEIGSPLLNNAQNITDKLNEMYSLKSDIEKINFVLVEEYGYILPLLKNFNNVKVFEMPIGNISQKNERYIKKLGQDTTYKDYNGITCIICEYKNENKLIDGYHRYISALSNNKQLIKVIEYC
jgi:hypothetical protein